MKINLYKELKNKCSVIEVAEGQTIAQAFEGVDISDAVIIANGHKVRADYKMKAGDAITVRLLPQGVTTALIIGLAVVAVAAGVVGGIALYQSLKAQEEAEEELEKIKKLSNRPTIDNRPFLRGASNTLATGNSQPYIIGRHFFTPYLHCRPFYKLSGTDGADQYTYQILEAGFNKQNIKKLAIDDIIIKNFAGETAQQGSYNLDGGQIFAEGELEISQDGSLLQKLPELNYKVVSTPRNAEIARDVTVEAGEAPYLTFTLDPAALDVDVAITFPNGLYAFNDDGDKVATQLDIVPEYSLDGGGSWASFTFDNNGVLTNTFNRLEATKELRYAAHKDFTLADYEMLKANNQQSITIRVRSSGAKDGKIKNDAYVLYSQSVCFDPNKSSAPAGILNDKGTAGLVPCLVVEDRERRYSTLIGLKVKATKNNKDKLKKINIITEGMARTWNGTQWSADKVPTRNPAAWVLEILTSTSHPASRYEDDEIDLESLGDLYEHCENNGFYYDAVIANNTKKLDTLTSILQACGAVLYTDIYGRQAVAIDRPQENALAVYNAQNIISISNKKDFTRHADGVRIRYIDSTDDAYRENTYLLMRDGADGKPLPITPDSIIKEVQLKGVTTFSHVVKYARRLMAVEILRPKTTTIEVGNEGVFYTPLSKVLIQDDSLKIGTGNATIKSVQFLDGRLSIIKLNGFVTFEDGKNYGLVVNAFDDVGAVPIKIKVSGTGYTDTLFVNTEILPTDPVQIEAGNVCSFGEINRETTPYIISNIRRSGTRYTLELVNYDEAIFDVGTIPPYISNITEPPAPVPDIPQSFDGADGKDGEAGLTIFIEKPALVYNADSDGKVPAQETTCRVRIFQQGEPLPFTIGEIESPAGFVVSAIGSLVYIKALEGSAMALDGVIKIPINYRPILRKWTYVDGLDALYTDENGDSYGDYTFADTEQNYDLFISYGKSVAGKKGEKGKDGEKGATGDRGAKYWGILTTIPTQKDIVIGDYYLDKNTIRIWRCRSIDNENNAIWEELDITKEENKYLYNSVINDIISLLSNVADTDDSVKLANAYIELLLTETIFTDSLFAKVITVAGKLIADKFFDTNGNKTSQGFNIDAVKGNIEANDITIRGDYAAAGLTVVQNKYSEDIVIDLKNDDAVTIINKCEKVLNVPTFLQNDIYNINNGLVFVTIATADDKDYINGDLGGDDHMGIALERRINNSEGVNQYSYTILGEWGKRRPIIINNVKAPLSEEYANRFLIRYQPIEVKTQANVFKAAEIRSTMGYQYLPSFLYNGGILATQDEVFKFFEIMNIGAAPRKVCFLLGNGWMIEGLVYKISGVRYNIQAYTSTGTKSYKIEKSNNIKVIIDDLELKDIYL